MSTPTPRKLKTSESSYLKEVLRGMGITIRHVIKNLRNPEGMDTIQYPEVRKPMSDRYRGAHRLTTRPDGKLKCVACRFEIDMLRCIYCGFCVEACPKDAIRMDTRIYDISAYTRQDMVHTKNYMQDLMDGDKPIAEEWYRDNPENAPLGFRADIERVVTDK